MNTTRHTPGPWITDDRHVHPANGLTYPRGIEPETDVIVLVDTDCHKSGLLNDVDKANLCLIAAAPALLIALEAIKAALVQPVQFTKIRNGASCDVLRGDCALAVKMAEAAIAQATEAEVQL